MTRSKWDNDSGIRNWQELEPANSYWESRRYGLSRSNAAQLFLGKDCLSQSHVHINTSELSTHMHVIGATNVGKSFFLEGMLRQLILSGEGLCLIDPHGDLYHRILNFCAVIDAQNPKRRLSRRVIPFDLSNQEQIIGFNPIQRNARVMTFQVVALMEAIRKCWGQSTFNETPRLARWLFNSCYAVIDSGLTFLQLYNMVNPDRDPYRDAITARLTNPRIKAEWQWLQRQSPERREERIESCLNRIKPFVEHESIRPILGQHTNVLNFESVLQERKILLVNLAPQNVITEDHQRMIGTLLVNEIITAAFARKKGERQPFYFFIDEFQRFATKDICEILDGGRKFGLHLILAHQHLNQLKEKDPEVYYSTLTNARLKAIFGGLIDDDLEILTKELYTGELNPEEVKDEIWQTKYQPVETTRIVKSQSEGASSAESAGDISHVSLTTGNVHIPGSGPFDIPTLATMSDARVDGSTQSTATQAAKSSSRSQAQVPFYEYHPYQELSSRTFRSLEEQLYIRKAWMKRQPKQHLSILNPGNPVRMLKAPTIKEFEVSDKTLKQFMDKCFASAGCFKSKQEAILEIEAFNSQVLYENISDLSNNVETSPDKKPKKSKRNSKSSLLDGLTGKE